MKLCLVDYGVGNLHSVHKSFSHQANIEQNAWHILSSTKPEDILSATHIVLPGVGAFGACIDKLDRKYGTREALEEAVIKRAKPFLGICVGLQMMAHKSAEQKNKKGLSWLDGEVKKIKITKKNLKSPHMGWNNLENLSPHPVLNGLEGQDVYFVHQFYFHPFKKPSIWGEVSYGEKLCAIAGEHNYLGVQFHPEKSQKAGLQLISQFLKWHP